MASYRKTIVKGMPLSTVDSEVLDKVNEDIDWLDKTSKEQRELLNHYLLNLDKVHRVNPDSERNKNIQQGVREIMETIGRMITECKAKLGGHIIPMGSAHNGTKVGDLDELDFVYEIELDTLLQGKGSFRGIHYQQAIVYIEDRSDMEFIHQQFTSGLNVNHIISTLTSGEIPLDNEGINLTFRSILIKVLSTLKLPSGWGHGGFNRPHFSGIRLQGKSYLLQFDYLGSCAETPLRISVDFVPMIKLQSVRHVGTLQTLQKFIICKKKVQYTWMSLQNSTMYEPYFGHAEEQWLSDYSIESTPKKLIRICKVFSKLTKMYSPYYPGKACLEEIDNCLKAKQDDGSIKLSEDLSCTIQVSDQPSFLYEADDFITFSDLNETIRDACMVKSYMMKTIVLTMMSTDPCEGCKWTDDDLPNLIIAVYRLLLNNLNHFSVSSNKFLNQFGAVEKEFVDAIIEVNELSDKMQSLTLQRGSREVFPQLVPNTIETNPLLDESSVTHSSENLPLELEKTNFYEDNKESIKELKTSIHEVHFIISSRISALFKILRAVCEGKDSVTVTVLDRQKVTKDEEYRDPDVCRKIDYKDLLQALQESN